MLSNLKFISSSRSSGKLEFFELHFVVQANNFMEMKDFITLGQNVHCDRICCKQLANWGTFSKEEYQARANQLPHHPRHNEFLAILADPIFQEPLENLHDLLHLLENPKD
ncbi:hypothetical protein ACFL27_00115 [candidate division CSSED10-310 bacterium]|uniref:Uncharacterized protein n=1 Tax=candidate division CSSED10-310 bacterium TaxID=2855610 RepID=A0ABV6YR50_UNCC1